MEYSADLVSSMQSGNKALTFQILELKFLFEACLGSNHRSDRVLTCAYFTRSVKPRLGHLMN